MSPEPEVDDIETRVRAALAANGEPFEIKVLCPPRTLLAMANVTVVEGLAAAVAIE